MEEIEELKERGNDYFKMKSYESALEAYLNALDKLTLNEEDDSVGKNDEFETTVRILFISFSFFHQQLLNLSFLSLASYI